MNGISEIIARNGLSTSEKLLFTYFGEGKFFVMMFGSSNAEKIIVADSDPGHSFTISNFVKSSSRMGRYICKQFLQSKYNDTCEADSSSETDSNGLANMDVNVEDLVVNIEDEDVNNELVFTSIMTLSNVNNSCQGPVCIVIWTK